MPFIVARTVAAWVGMNDIADAKASFAEQAVIFQRKHNWLMCRLYTGTFGSFIGYLRRVPAAHQDLFPGGNSLQFVFLGPLVGALSRAVAGWIADKYGGGASDVLGVRGMIARGARGDLSSSNGQPAAFFGFFAMFMALFFFTGVGNSSTFQMIPVDRRREYAPRLMPGLDAAETRRRQSSTESAAIIAFTSAIAAYGAFFIPKAYGSSIALTGSADARSGGSSPST